jgi:hypothetical protein
MPTTINPNFPCPHTDLLRAGRLLTVTGPTQPSGATTTVILTRSGVTIHDDSIAVGGTGTYGGYNCDLQYSISANGFGATVSQQESVHSGSGLGVADTAAINAGGS